MAGGTDTGGDTLLIYNNIFANLSFLTGFEKAALNLYRKQSDTAHGKVYNNIIYNCYYGIYMGEGNELVNKNTPYNFEIYNNIIANSQSYHIWIHTTILNNLIDYNNYYVGSGDNWAYGTAGPNPNPVNWATWKSDISGDAHSINTDPQLINAGGSYLLATDFMIPVGSPCKDGGTTPLSTADYGGRTIPDDWIGAWGYWPGFPVGTPIPMGGYSP